MKVTSRTYKINSKIVKGLLRRQASAQSVKTFHVNDFAIEDSVIKDLAQTYTNLPYDYYDVAYKAEMLVREVEAEFDERFSKDWSLFLRNTHRDTLPLQSIYSFWQNHITHIQTLDAIQKLVPFRKRSCFEYLLTPYFDTLGRFNYNWQVEEVGAAVFSQQVSDLRDRTRFFKSPEKSVFRNKHLIQLMCNIATYALSTGFFQFLHYKHIKATMHQMLTYAGNSPAPEGIHQDGADFIVSAIVVDKKNCTGGISQIFYNKPQAQLNDKHRTPAELILQKTLNVGEGIFQVDVPMNYWHDVTPIRAIDTNKEAYRAILGFDFKVIG